MAGNTFGKAFTITTFGESHGAGIGVVVDGCPAGVSIDMEALQKQLDRRRPGQSAITTQRNESDTAKSLSGILNNTTTGSPILLWIGNLDQHSHDYDHIESVFRPSHADYTYFSKYGIRDHRGGGRSSARETAARVAGGFVAQAVCAEFGIDIKAYVSSVGALATAKSHEDLDMTQIDSNDIRCPDSEVAEAMIKLVEEVRDSGNTVGGVLTCVATNVPVGLGEPVFDRLEADLAKAMLSINATKGFEIGSGFAGTALYGNAHNDPFVKQEDGSLKTTSNNSGGVQGGISNGMPIHFKVAFKPVSTLMQNQQTFDAKGNPVSMEGKGRHDPCVVPRAVPIVEAMTALVLADHLLRLPAANIQSLKKALC
jgi:chorismate synthase